MSKYLGATPVTKASYDVKEFTATEGQTTFNLSYNPNFLDVLVRGVQLAKSDYTATDGLTVTLNEPVTAGFVVTFKVWGTFNPVDTYTQGVVDDKVATLEATKQTIITASETATIGANGDFATINQALEYYSKRSPVYKSAGIQVTLQLQAGFVMEEQVLVRGLDLGWITITGVDAQTTIDHTALTTDFTSADYGFDSYPAFGASKGGVLPRVGQLFIFSAANVGGEKHGVMTTGAGSSADVLEDCGIVAAGQFGIVANRGATINAELANASGAGQFGIIANRGSTINANSANASGAGTYGIYATSGGIINATEANASGAGQFGIIANRGSTINAELANASGAGTYGIYATSGGIINANSANASGAGERGIFANRGSIINATEANARKGATDSADDFRVANGSYIAANAGIGGTSQAVNTLTTSGIIHK